MLHCEIMIILFYNTFRSPGILHIRLVTTNESAVVIIAIIKNLTMPDRTMLSVEFWTINNIKRWKIYAPYACLAHQSRNGFVPLMYSRKSHRSPALIKTHINDS